MKTIKIELTVKQSAILIALLRQDNDKMTANIEEIFNGPAHSADRADLFGDIADNEEILRVLEGGDNG